MFLQLIKLLQQSYKVGTTFNPYLLDEKTEA